MSPERAKECLRWAPQENQKPALKLPALSAPNVAAGFGLHRQGDLGHNSPWFQIRLQHTDTLPHLGFFLTFETEQEGAKKELTAFSVSPSRRK